MAERTRGAEDILGGDVLLVVCFEVCVYEANQCFVWKCELNGSRRNGQKIPGPLSAFHLTSATFWAGIG